MIFSRTFEKITWSETILFFSLNKITVYYFLLIILYFIPLNYAQLNIFSTILSNHECNENLANN